MKTTRYLIPSHGSDGNTLEKALLLAADLHAQLKSKAPVTLFTPANSTLGSSSVVTQVVGTPAAKALIKGESVSLTPAVMLRHESQKSLSPYKSYGIIIAIYPNGKMLNQIDSLTSVDAIIVVPWTMEEVEVWIATWGPSIPGQAATSPQRTIASHFVEVALENLTSSINLSTGLGHPLDKAKAVNLFRGLKKLKEAYDPAEIRAWAVQHNWMPDAADELKRIGEAIRDGRPIRCERGYEWSGEYVERMRAKAKERESK